MEARRSLAALFIGILAVTPACSAFAGSLQPVTIQASHPRAEIYVDGALVGTGAATVELKRNRSHAVMARLGDGTASAHIGKSISSTGILDIVGGLIFLVPFIGVATPGFWELDQDTIFLSLPSVASVPPPSPTQQASASTLNDEKTKESFEALTARQEQLPPGGVRP